MAATGARRILQFSTSSVRAPLSRSSTTTFASKAAELGGLASSKSSSGSRFFLGRVHSKLPVELGGALSLMPLHSVTASALFTSLLSLNNENWGCLSEVVRGHLVVVDDRGVGHNLVDFLSNCILVVEDTKWICSVSMKVFSMFLYQES